MSTIIDCGLDLAGVTASAQRVFFVALIADGEYGPRAAWWSDLARHPEWSAAWNNVTTAAPVLILKYEGAAWPEVTQEAYQVFGDRLAGLVPVWDDLVAIERLAWEAVARHLTWLFDLDEPLEAGELASSEVRYGDWAKSRLSKERGPS